MPSMYLFTRRRGTPEDGRAVWADLRVCLTSIEAYGLDYLDEVIVAWDGPWAPDGMPEHPKFRYLERPPELNQPQAANWAIQQTDATELVQMSDDVVLHPDTMRFLFEDIASIRQQAPHLKVGIVGPRSNWVCDQQNVRASNGGQLIGNGTFYSTESEVIQTDRIYTLMCYYPREAYEQAGRFPDDLVYFGDMLFSYDLERLGYSHFVSRAYVHHVGFRGSRNTGDNELKLWNEGIAWLAANKPDFLRTWVQRGYLPREGVPASIWTTATAG